ncbi:uncharacterized protein [Henckelia pumila]|uniref:uncharacterized protein n=1 Tax=Henckelia pumila TaxID=405737 RepID=UPI003C6E62FF
MGASHSFISDNFVLMHVLPCEPLPAVIAFTSTFAGGIVSVRFVRKCELRFEDALTKHRAIVDCFQKVVRFRPEMAEEWKFFGKGSRSIIPLISILSMTRLLQKGSEGFLIYVVDILKSNPELVDIPVVREFADIFPDGIPGLPSIREIEFSIDLLSGP